MYNSTNFFRLTLSQYGKAFGLFATHRKNLSKFINGKNMDIPIYFL